MSDGRAVASTPYGLQDVPTNQHAVKVGDPEWVRSASGLDGSAGASSKEPFLGLPYL